MKVKEVLQQFDKLAPLSLSHDAQKNIGFYDNSGLILDCATDTESVVVALDFTDDVIEYAKEVGAKLIISHHPAIYKGIRSVTGSYVKAIAAGITVYSAHLNLDSANGGIDDTLARFAGAKDTRILTHVNETNGFGRVFSVPETTCENLVNRLIAQLHTDKYMFFGNKDKKVNTVATFCGAGLGEEGISNASEADLLISADIQHHVLLAALNQGKCVLQLTHYASEAFAMKTFVEELFEKEINIKCYFYVDKRFL